MSAAKFVVVTDDGMYRQGEKSAFLELDGQPTARLESWKPDGDYIVLCFEGGVKRAVPESRIRYIDEASA